MITAPPPVEHGGDGHRLAALLGIQVDQVLDLSASLNPVAADIARVAAPHLGVLGRYPDAASARGLLADAMGIDQDRLLLTNGGSEAIALVAAETGAGWVDEPDFSLYRRHLPVVTPEAPRWRSNPHSPSGLLAAANERAAVWDESFYPLATGCWTRGDEGATVIGSLTKLFACPGLRLGYVLAEPDLIVRLAARQPLWSVNGLALAVLPDLLDGLDLPRWCATVASLRRDLVDLLLAHGFNPQASDAPWVLLPSANGLRDRLAPSGILVRDTGSFGLPDGVRIAVPDGAGLVRLAAALQATA
jgi:histidinol-phosphate/aromatic aminotransferase/cobyric acid decarboxylase-like protein